MRYTDKDTLIVRCSTQKEYEDLEKIVSRIGRRFSLSYNYWESYKDKTCIWVYPKSSAAYGSYAYYESHWKGRKDHVYYDNPYMITEADYEIY